MKVISTNNSKFYIFKDGTTTYDYLPCGYYTVNFSKQEGFYLEKSVPFNVNQRLYGTHKSKVDKIINAYKHSTSNFGVILSGDKGLGKSLAMRLLAQRLYKQNYPVIIVNTYIYGIADFLHNITCDCAILFDEFDKVFKNRSDPEDKSVNPQEELLSLFDGLDEYHRLFVITANKIHDINEYFLNRPGRFQYHLIFSYPSDKDIAEYMNDNLNDKNMLNELPRIQRFSKKTPLNYDALRAICFELNNGLTFDEAIADLNIINLDDMEYNVVLSFTNGMRLNSKTYLNLFSDEPEDVWFSNNEFSIKGTFIPLDTKYDINGLFIPLEKVTLNYSCIDSFTDKDDDFYRTLIRPWKLESVRIFAVTRSFKYSPAHI